MRRESFSLDPVVVGTPDPRSFPGTLRLGISLSPTEGGSYDLPVAIWPVRLWPKDATVDTSLVSYTTTSTFPLPTTPLPYSVYPRVSSVYQTLDGFHREGEEWTILDVLVPIAPLADAAPSLGITIYNNTGSTAAKRTHTLSGPGYYVLDGEGAITRTAPADLPNLPTTTAPPPGSDPQPPVDNPPVEDAPDMTPMPPVDPCRGSCGASQVCVAGA